MKNIKAFPTHPPQPNELSGDEHGYINGEGGMDLRDYFAAKILQALLTDSRWPFEDRVLQQLTEECYKVADAMMDAREKEGAA